MKELKCKTIKRFCKILGRVVVTVFIVVYVAVALLNYSLVQSFAGSAVSDWATREWGGSVRVGSMGCNPFNHLVLRGVELVSPEGDTICRAHTMAFRFKRFPFDEHGLTFSQVRLKDTYYHLGIDSTGLNLGFIINYFAARSKPSEGERGDVEFKVLVDDLVLDNVTYRHDLGAKSGELEAGSGRVDIKHQEWAGVRARMRNVRVDKDYVTCRIERFTTRERSGLNVKEMSMNVYATRVGISVTNMVLQTDDSRLMGDVLLDFRGWKMMSHFFDSVVFTCHFEEGSYGGLRDAAFWTGALAGMDERVELSGWFGGPIADFSAEGVHLAFGAESSLDLDARICGLPNIDSTVISAKIWGLHTTYADLAAVRHPEGVTMKAEGLVRRLERIDLNAEFEGRVFDFVAMLDLQSVPGRVGGELRLAMDPKRGKYRYSGSIESDGFGIGRVAPNEWVSHSAFDLTFEGSGFDPKTMRGSAQGRLRRTVVKGKRLVGETAVDVAAADGKVNAELSLDDALAAVSAGGEVEFRERGPIYRANVDVEHLNLKELGLWKDSADSESVLDVQASGFYSDMGEGNSFARLTLNDVRLRTKTVTKTKDENVKGGGLYLKKVSMTAREQNRWKSWTLSSDVASAQMRGYFSVDALGETVRRFVEDYVPQVKAESGKRKAESESVVVADANFEFNATLNDTVGLLQMFVPELFVANGSTVQANYNGVESCRAIVRSDSIGWGGLKVYNVGVNGEPVADRYRLRVTSDEIKMGELLLSENADIAVETSKRTADCRIYWENSSQTVGGGDVNFRLMADSGRVSLAVDPSQMALGGREWDLLETESGKRKAESEASQEKGIFFDEKGFFVGGLAMVSGEEQLLLKASRRAEPSDSIELTFRNFGLGVVNPFLGALAMSADGVANGNIRIGFLHKHENENKNLNHNHNHNLNPNGNEWVPYLNGDLNIDGLGLNGEQLGNARVRSTWNADMNQLNLLVDTRRNDFSEPLHLVGYLDMSSEDAELNFTAGIDGVDMKVLRPLVQSFSSEVGGTIYGEAEIGGTLKEPVVEGYLFLKDALLKVDFLNVTYVVSDTVVLERDAIRLDDVVIYDERGNEAVANGAIRHNHLKDMAFDIKIASERLLCMNTSARDGEAYYGTVLASVDGTVVGTVDDLDIVLDARTVSGSSLHIPINDKRQLKQVDYIHFGTWSDYDENENLNLNPNLNFNTNLNLNEKGYAENDGSSRFALTINVETTPDVRLELPMDFSSVTVNVDARGGGDLQLQVGSDAPFTLKGDYEIIGGTVALDILGVIGKDFAIDEGSSITFPGAISDALFDIKAVYSQRVNMSTLTGSLSATESQKPVQVENVIALSGTLQSPDINFDLRLPNADQSVQEEVFAYIDRTNERDMLNQTVSLLLLKKFYNSSTSTNDGFATSTAEEGYGLVANTLGSMVSDMVEFVDINFDYQAGNALTTEQYALDISKEWNKFYFETTLGFGGEAREMSNANGGNNMTGDMVVGYKINPRFHLFVFNRSNTNDYTRSDLPYKQGVGVKYTRDFDTFGELLRRNKKRKKQ